MFLFGAEAKLSVSRYLVCSLLIVCMCGTKNILSVTYTIFKQGWCPISYVFLRKKEKKGVELWLTVLFTLLLK